MQKIKCKLENITTGAKTFIVHYFKCVALIENSDNDINHDTSKRNESKYKCYCDFAKKKHENAKYDVKIS